VHSTKVVSLPASLGFRGGTTSVHTSRTMMLDELSLVLARVAPEATIDVYVSAIVDENILGKRTQTTRQRSAKRLAELYALDPACTVFRFSCLVNCHKLSHKGLENLTYSYLGDWIKAQNADAKAGKPGADLRLGAAQGLQEKLKLILAGEPPYDIFVRWKPLSEQAIGWNPDLNDGVRMNIRPFVEAGILRKPPNIKWTKDRGKEPERDRDEYPWFWDGREFVGDRVNDVHLTNAQKQAARNSGHG
jgi:hypothetical protein